jgi:signal transduction histidine kinase
MLAELQGAHEQVEESLQRLRSFVADVSHELRTPLTTIRGNLSLLGQRDLSHGDQREILADTVGETERLIRLVTDLLTLARAEARRQLRLGPVPLAPLIQDVCRQARLLDPERIILCESLADATALADRDAMEQALLALLDNALKHGEGTITVAVRARPDLGTDADDTMVAVDVRDSGPGIEPKALPHLFERFSRGERAADTPGLGLGLPIARALMEAQHGALTVESAPGRGSVFTMIVPRARRPVSHTA